MCSAHHVFAELAAAPNSQPARASARSTAARATAHARAGQEAESKLRMVTSLWNVLDFLAIFPPLVELVLLHGANVPFTLGRLDLRWFKILRRGPPRPGPCARAAAQVGACLYAVRASRATSAPAP